MGGKDWNDCGVLESSFRQCIEPSSTMRVGGGERLRARCRWNRAIEIFLAGFGKRAFTSRRVSGRSPHFMNLRGLARGR